MAIREARGLTAEFRQLPREAVASTVYLNICQHARTLRAGQLPDSIIETAAMRQLTRGALHERCESVAVPNHF
jgi:hypothetical protein